MYTKLEMWLYILVDSGDNNILEEVSFQESVTKKKNKISKLIFFSNIICNLLSGVY